MISKRERKCNQKIEKEKVYIDVMMVVMIMIVVVVIL